MAKTTYTSFNTLASPAAPAVVTTQNTTTPQAHCTHARRRARANPSADFTDRTMPLNAACTFEKYARLRFLPWCCRWWWCLWCLWPASWLDVADIPPDAASDARLSRWRSGSIMAVAVSNHARMAPTPTGRSRTHLQRAVHPGCGHTRVDSHTIKAVARPPQQQLLCAPHTHSRLQRWKFVSWWRSLPPTGLPISLPQPIANAKPVEPVAGGCC